MANDESVVVASVSTDKAEILGGAIADALVSCSLKRKRPPKIEIPNVLREISTDVFKGWTVSQGKTDGPVCFADSGVAVFSLKGKKKFMEDAYKIFASSNGNKVLSCFFQWAISSVLCSINAWRFSVMFFVVPIWDSVSINEMQRFFGVYDGHGGSKAAEFVAENLHLKIIEMLEGTSENHVKEEACKAGFLKTDEEFLKQVIITFSALESVSLYQSIQLIMCSF